MNLKINGKTYPLEWGTLAYEIYCDKLDCDLADMNNHLATEKIIDRTRAITNLTLAAIENGCDSNSVEFDLTYRDLVKWMDMQPQEIAHAIVEDWKKSYYFGKTVAEYFFGETEVAVDSNTNKKKRPSAK